MYFSLGFNLQSVATWIGRVREVNQKWALEKKGRGVDENIPKMFGHPLWMSPSQVR